MKVISKQAFQRLPYYHGYLKDFGNKEEYISSSSIANALGLSEIQVRKDLAAVSKTAGIPKKGFKVINLLVDIEEYLGYNSISHAVLAGAGQLGRALLSYKGFEQCGVSITRAFDIDENAADGKRIFPIGELASYLKKTNIKIGIITVPASAAQQVCDLMIENGICAVWNFAPVHLKAGENILIQNENLASSLALLSNHLRESIERREGQ